MDGKDSRHVGVCSGYVVAARAVGEFDGGIKRVEIEVKDLGHNLAYQTKQGDLRRSVYFTRKLLSPMPAHNSKREFLCLLPRIVIIRTDFGIAA